jgi:predicted double-glycine peptidase
MSSLKWLALILLLTTGSSHAVEAGSAQVTQIAGVPFVKQENGFCGPVALAEVMAYYQVHDDQKTIARAIYLPKLQGTLITDLERYAIDKGFTTRLAQGTPAEVQDFIRQGRPVIVLIDRGFWAFSRPHYLVVIGFDERGFIAHTGMQAACSISEADFQKTWAKKGSTYLLIWR